MTLPRSFSVPPERDKAALLRYGSATSLCIALLALLGGCGSSSNGVASKSAIEILAASTMAAQNASSVRIGVRSGGGGATLTLNASLAKDASHAQLSLLSVRVEAIRTGDTIYIKGNRVFDARLERTLGVKIPSGAWLKGPASGPLGRIGGYTKMRREVSLILNDHDKVTKGPIVKLEGQPAIELREAHQLYTGRLYVATTGRPYPIKLIKRGQESGQITFSGWNDPVTVSAPANALELSQLEHEGLR
jgi:hypothetical protein